MVVYLGQGIVTAGTMSTDMDVPRVVKDVIDRTRKFILTQACVRVRNLSPTLQAIRHQ